MIIVSKTKFIDPITEKRRAYKYSDLRFDSQGWMFDLSKLPIPYDLMYIKLKDLPHIKTGWWTGKKWEGLRLKSEEIVIAWKRNFNIEVL